MTQTILSAPATRRQAVAAIALLDRVITHRSRIIASTAKMLSDGPFFGNGLSLRGYFHSALAAGSSARSLAGYKPEEAIQRLLMFVKKFPTNNEMLKGIPG